jgi:hypothetical protein
VPEGCPKWLKGLVGIDLLAFTGHGLDGSKALRVPVPPPT